MVLDYAAMETTHIPNFLGGEGTIHAQMRVDELGKIQSEGRARRAAAEEELGRIEGELKQKLLELRG